MPGLFGQAATHYWLSAQCRRGNNKAQSFLSVDKRFCPGRCWGAGARPSRLTVGASQPPSLPGCLSAVLMLDSSPVVPGTENLCKVEREQSEAPGLLCTAHSAAQGPNQDPAQQKAPCPGTWHSGQGVPATATSSPGPSYHSTAVRSNLF